MKVASSVRIEYMPITDLVGWPGNPKEHDIGAIIVSIRQHGFVNPIIIDETTQRIVAGHGRLSALYQMWKSGEPVPGRVRVDLNENWSVPVLRGVSFASEKDAEAYLVASNRLVELGGWDQIKLAEMLQSLANSGNINKTGYDTNDLNDLLEVINPERDLKKLEEEYGEFDPTELWPIISVKVPPHILEKYHLILGRYNPDPTEAFIEWVEDTETSG